MKRKLVPATHGVLRKNPGTSMRIALRSIMLVLVGLASSCGPRVTGGDIKTGSTSVSSDWVSVPLPQPITAKWDVQLVYVDVSSPFQVSYDPLGIRLEDGTVAVPELELVTTAGQKEPFQLKGAISRTVIIFRNDQIARGTTFSELRMRSPVPLVSSRISWISCMPGEGGKVGKC